MDDEQQTGIAEAVEKAGTQRALADKLGCTQQVVSEWVRRGHVPLDRADEIEAAYGIAKKRLLSPRLAALISA